MVKRRCAFSKLMGLTLISIEQHGDEEIQFKTRCGRNFILYHQQDCCESVTIDEVIGDYEDLLHTPILSAEEISNSDDSPRGHNYSHTWTFYKLSTIKGSVTIRWYGESSGYYSEEVDFAEILDS